jgi:hypothetical protein
MLDAGGEISESELKVRSSSSKTEGATELELLHESLETLKADWEGEK